MKFLKKMMQIALAVFFFGLLATSAVFADTTGGQFVDKDNRKYYIKDDHKAIYWHKIDGKTFYFGDSGEMVVGWQYIEIFGTGYRDNLFDNHGVKEIGLQHKWYYFGQDGALLESTDKQVLEAKTSENTGKVYGENYNPSAKKRAYYFDEDYALKIGWIYEDGHWYYLNKIGRFANDSYYPLPIGEIARGWTQDFRVTISIDRSTPAPWYYLDPTTGIMQTGWQYLGNKWYYLRSSGAMATGWYLDGSTWYYLDAQNGDMKTGWIYVGNTWYYLRSSGAMVTGWFQVNGKWYYAYSSGALAVNTTVDGYYVNYNGEWVQ